jgi:pyrroline-5-carboxylate reductase
MDAQDRQHGQDGAGGDRGSYAALAMPRALVVLGGGNMGGALAMGCARAWGAMGEARPRIVVVEPRHEAAATLRGAGLDVVASIDDARGALGSKGALGGECVVVLAVKPQVWPEVAPALARVLAQAGTDALVVSVMAGVTTARIAAALAQSGGVGGEVRVVRTMPNLGAMIGRSTTGVCAGARATREDVARACAIMECVGSVERIDESLMDAFTGVAGSGPAFLFYLAEAMAQGGVRAGFEEGQSRRIVASTLEAAARLLRAEEPRADGAAWRAKVTSKGGTTHAAISHMENLGVREAIAGAIVAARDRGRELGA